MTEAIEQAVEWLMENRRLGTGSINEYQRRSDDAQMREAYRDILTKAAPFFKREGETKYLAEIRMLGEMANCCTFDILGEVCSYCRCDRKLSD